MIERTQKISHAIKDGEVVHVVTDELVIKDEVFNGARRIIVNDDLSWRDVRPKGAR